MTARLTRISTLMIEESECEDQQRIETEIINYCKQLYFKNTRTAAWFSTWVGKHIPHEQTAWLERPFEEEETEVDVFSLAAVKAPGPDGFTMAFSKNARKQ